MPRVDPVDMDRHVGPPTPGQRARGRLLLDRQQLAEPMSAQVAELFDVGVQLRNRQVDAALASPR